MSKSVAKALIVYHDKCNDGYTSAWVTHTKLVTQFRQESIHFLPANYNDIGPLLNLINDHYYSQIYVVDFSLPLSVLHFLEQEYPECSITILDHHKTAFELYAPEIVITPTANCKVYVTSTAYVVLDNSESGASLCWKYFFPELAMPKLVRYVKDYDLYKFELGEITKWMRQVIRRMVFSPETWSSFSRQLQNTEEHDKIALEGKRLHEEEAAEAKRIADRAYPIIINGISGWVVSCSYEYTSLVGHLVAQRDNSFCLIVPPYTSDRLYDKEHGDWFTRKLNFSLRSVAGIDVSAIAKIFGGGGHKNAAGFHAAVSDILSDKIQLMIMRGKI